jgi:hypothetical protein
VHERQFPNAKERIVKIVWRDEEPTLSEELVKSARDALVSYVIFYVFDRLTGNR